MDRNISKLKAKYHLDKPKAYNRRAIRTKRNPLEEPDRKNQLEKQFRFDSIIKFN